MEETIRLGRVAGIPIGFNWSMLVVFWLITWGLADGRFPADYPGHSDAAYWVTAAVAAVLFYASLLAHELGHSLVARRNGVEVEGITLWLFGGVAKIKSEATDPKSDLRIAVIGPAVSFGLGALFGLAAFGLDALGAGELAVGAFGWLAVINVVLAVFNLAPAAPLDGGRVLRALLWQRRGDRTSASVTAARSGRVFGYILIAVGLLELTAAGAVGGLWFVFLGWFLLNAARAEETHVLLRGALAETRVRDVMTEQPLVAPSSLTVTELIEEFVLIHPHSTYPVEADDGSLLGLVTFLRLKQVPVEQRGTTRVADVARPLADVPTASPDELLIDLLERLSDDRDGRALVFEHDRLVGIVSPSDVANAISVASLRPRRANTPDGPARDAPPEGS